jgi:hypothetical protein
MRRLSAAKECVSSESPDDKHPPSRCVSARLRMQLRARRTSDAALLLHHHRRPRNHTLLTTTHAVISWWSALQKKRSYRTAFEAAVRGTL